MVNDGGDCEEAIGLLLSLLFRCGGLEYWF